MDSLISFDGLGKPANSLINKLASVTGFVMNQIAPGPVAVNRYIEDIKKSDYDPLMKAAFISNARRTIKEYCNQANIVKIAIEVQMEKARPEEIDEDWLSQFMDKARLVSDEEFQLIWGKILAEECNKPGSIPQALLHILERMDRKDAGMFSALCATAFYVLNDGAKDYFPFLLGSLFRENFYSDLGLDYNSLSDLEALGLIQKHMASDYLYIYCAQSTPITIHCGDLEYTFPESIDTFPLGSVMFTKSGKALCGAIQVERQEGYFENICVPFFKREAKAFKQ